MPRWSIDGVLVAGRRVSGEANGRDAAEAVRHLAAAEARSRKVDVGAAVAGALADRYKKVSELGPASAEADAILPDPGDYSDWPAMGRSARAVAESADRGELEREFIGRDDDFWDVEWVPDGGSDDGRESGASSFRKSGYSGVQCTGFACEVLSRLGPHRVQVYGFSRDDNPGSSVAQDYGGHDFAIVDDRYVVDPWLTEVDGAPRGVFDLQDPEDASEITRLYGDRRAWKAATPSGRAVAFR